MLVSPPNPKVVAAVDSDVTGSLGAVTALTCRILSRTVSYYWLAHH